MNGEHKEKYQPKSVPTAEYKPQSEDNKEEKPVSKGNQSYRLEDLAFTRSGDKGNTCNIGKS